jgi:hypothetical protein
MMNDWNFYFWKNNIEDAPLSSPSSAELEFDWDVYHFENDFEHESSDRSSISALGNKTKILYIFLLLPSCVFLLIILRRPTSTHIEADWSPCVKDEDFFYTQLIVKDNSLDCLEQPLTSETSEKIVDTFLGEDKIFYSELVGSSNTLEQQSTSEPRKYNFERICKDDEPFYTQLEVEEQVEPQQTTQDLFSIACATPLPAEKDLFEIACSTSILREVNQSDVTITAAETENLPPSNIAYAYDVEDEVGQTSIPVPRTAELPQPEDVNYTAYPIPALPCASKYHKRRSLDYQDYQVAQPPVEKRRRLRTSSVDLGRPQTHVGHRMPAYTTKNAIIMPSSSSVTAWKRSCRVCGKRFSSFGQLIDHLRLLRHFSDSVDNLWEQGFRFPVSDDLRQVHRRQSLPGVIAEEEL